MLQPVLPDVQLTPILESARSASIVLASAPTALKNAALGALADHLRAHVESILEANRDDLATGAENGLTAVCSTGSPWTSPELRPSPMRWLRLPF